MQLKTGKQFRTFCQGTNKGIDLKCEVDDGIIVEQCKRYSSYSSFKIYNFNSNTIATFIIYELYFKDKNIECVGKVNDDTRPIDMSIPAICDSSATRSIFYTT